MKTVFLLIMMLLTIVLSGTVDIQAQGPKRIQFEKGKSFAVIKTSTGQYGTSFVVRARLGQKLVLDLTPAAKVGVRIETNGRYGEMVLLREESGGRYEVGLEENGDYTIFVGSIVDKPVVFTLTIQIKKLADI